MKRVLVLGGTRFFGKKLVSRLIAQGMDVTIATRGKTPDPFGDQVTRLALNREDAQSLQAAVGAITWDLVYDNICYSPQAAADACAFFAGNVKRYILTSSQAVYPLGSNAAKEQDFDPYTFPLRMGGRLDFSYAEGKRLAEAVFFQRATFPVCAVRFPIVLGLDDYTKRLHFHLEHVKQELPIGIPHLESSLSFIHSDEAADFLSWLAKVKIAGPVNACASDNISLRRLLSLIEENVGKKALVVDSTASEHASPFGVPDSWIMDATKAQAAGFSFSTLEEWLPPLIATIAATL